MAAWWFTLALFILQSQVGEARTETDVVVVHGEHELRIVGAAAPGETVAGRFLLIERGIGWGDVCVCGSAPPAPSVQMTGPSSFLVEDIVNLTFANGDLLLSFDWSALSGLDRDLIVRITPAREPSPLPTFPQPEADSIHARAAALPDPDFESVALPDGLTWWFLDRSSDEDGIRTWLWDFGDGSTPSTDRNPQHRYLAGGAYDVTLLVTDAKDDADYVRRSLSVLAAAAGPPPVSPPLAAPSTGAAVPTAEGEPSLVREEWVANWAMVAVGAPTAFLALLAILKLVHSEVKVWRARWRARNT